ncbi:MAG: DUF5777 family beta-barrel protein [Chitinophagales bacterium]|nr:DUF5777 family beta-barrel protein [Chitinophagales bacterium]
MKKLLLLLGAFCFLASINAQENIYETFKDTRVVNMHSVETLGKRKLDVRIGHRFGDLAGDNGGWPTFYGLENASDVVIGAEYGFTDNFMAGIFRSKGAGSMPDGQAGLRQVINATAKYKVVRQSDQTPLTVTLSGVGSMSAAEKIEDNPDVLRSFDKFAHRLAYSIQLILGRKFSDRFSLQLAPGLTHRNLVPFEDENNIFTVAAGTRIQMSKVFSLVADATFPFSDVRTSDNGFYPAVGLGFEFDTGGHVFQVNFTNATGMIATDYVPYTTSNWGDGEFRLGFTISRVFNL